jgi:hypothetical protein
MDVDQGGRVVRDDGHPPVNDGATMAFVQEARRSSIHGSSRRRRKWASPGGSTKGAWDPSTSTALIPQAYFPARSVRHRVQIGSSEQAHACVRRANATHTRVETGGRPRLRVRGQRGANEHSTAATRAVHGHVSAHGPRGCRSGTKSATWRHGPRPVSPCWRDRQSGMVGSPDGGRRAPQQTTIRSPGQSVLGGIH